MHRLSIKVFGALSITGTALKPLRITVNIINHSNGMKGAGNMESYNECYWMARAQWAENRNVDLFKENLELQENLEIKTLEAARLDKALDAVNQGLEHLLNQ